MQWRQGDVLIERVAAVADNFVLTNDNLLVRGEGKFHGHFIEGRVAIYANPNFGPEDTTSHCLVVDKDGVLKHLHTETKNPTGEHQQIALKPGTYRVIRQREYNPYARVIDIIKD